MKRNACFFVLGLLFFTNVLGKTVKTSSFVVDFLKEEKVFFEQDSLSFTVKDTIKLIEDHIRKADVNKNKGLYTSSYDDLWKALSLAKSVNSTKQLVSIYNELGVLYGIYGKQSKAIEHKLVSLAYVKKAHYSEENAERFLRRAYYSLAIQYRKAGEYAMGMTYLDSCLYVSKDSRLSMNAYALAEKGKLFMLQNNFVEAEPLLLKSKELLEAKNRHYLVVVYSFLGDLYAHQKDLKQAILFYEKSINSIDKFKTHADLKTDVLKKLAALYQQKKQIAKAYSYLHESTKIADSLFSMRNENNSQLFEIKNKYEETLLKKDRRINEQKHVIEKKKRVQVQLLFTIAFIVFVVIGLVFLLYHKVKVRRLQLEQEHAATQIQHDKDKLNAVLETKSKELTVSALQLIEKDKNIDQLLDVIKKEAPDIHRKLEKEIVRGNKDLWERFNLRFTEVNTDFYNRLRKKHETLTPTEQKHCALIKLKFDSKEMARLLNISVNSVHISRHRIRKKIGLQRDDDLSNYIGGI